MKHIRKSGHGRDRRSRGHRFPNNLTPTLCGAEPTVDDVSRKDARHLVEHFSVVRPAWVETICPACRERLENRRTTVNTSGMPPVGRA